MGRCNRAFVTPTDFGSHSMLHQTLIPSSPSSSSAALFPFASSPSSPLPLLPLRLLRHPPPPPPPPPPMVYASSQVVEKETNMEPLSFYRGEVASLQQQQQQQQQQQGFGVAEEVGFMERGNLMVEGFSVDELLDLGEFAGPEQDEEEAEAETVEELQAEAAAEAAAEGVAGCGETELHTESSNSGSLIINSSVSTSPLPFDAPPPPSDDFLPEHDAEEFEWVSLLMDDTLSEMPPPCAAAAPPAAAGAGPVPSPTVCALATEAFAPVKAKRSKRSRGGVGGGGGAAWSLSSNGGGGGGGSSSAPFSDSSSSSSSSATTSTTTTTTTTSSCSSSPPLSSLLVYDLPLVGASSDPGLFLLHDSSDSDHPPHLPPPPPRRLKLSPPSKSTNTNTNTNNKQKPKKKRGRKPKQHQHQHQHQHKSRHHKSHLRIRHQGLPPPASQIPPAGERRCSHCGVQKTPQWRAGPEGAKTLCNACGVRYKSGRLLPEYRPACSPTFVSDVHSNSHRKVLEMRRKKEAALLPLPLPSAAPLPVPSF